MGQIISVYGDLLLTAMGQTLLLALCGLFFACILGLIFGMMSVLKSRVCNIIAAVFVDIIRGVPMIVLAFFVYFGVPMVINDLFNSGFTLSPLQAGTICLALNCGAYMAEIVVHGLHLGQLGVAVLGALGVVDGLHELFHSGSSTQLGYALLARHAARGIAAGNPHDDSKHNQPIYHYVERYLHFVRHWISGAGKYCKKCSGNHI